LSGSNDVFNIARGRIGWYAADALGLGVNATSYLVINVLQVVEADDTLNNYDDWAAVLGGSNTEAASTNYAEITLDDTAVTITIDDTANDAQAEVDADQTWSSVSQAASESWVKLLMNYSVDYGTTPDSGIIPLTYHSFDVTPNGGDITADFDQTNGFWRST
jgi:hypothetical protein